MVETSQLPVVYEDEGPPREDWMDGAALFRKLSGAKDFLRCNAIMAIKMSPRSVIGKDGAGRWLEIARSSAAYGGVQRRALQKGNSWIPDVARRPSQIWPGCSVHDRCATDPPNRYCPEGNPKECRKPRHCWQVLAPLSRSGPGVAIDSCSASGVGFLC